MVGKGDFSSKPRPGLVVQANAFNDQHPAITVCPITSHVAGDGLFRIAITPDPINGLARESEIEIDRLQAVWRVRIHRTIGTASDDIMFTVDQALRRWMAL